MNILNRLITKEAKTPNLQGVIQAAQSSTHEVENTLANEANQLVMTIMGEPQVQHPKYSERFYNITPELARKLLEDFLSEFQRNPRKGNVLRLAIIILKGLLISELRSIDFQHNKVIDGMHLLLAICKTGIAVRVRCRFWENGVRVMEHIDQGASRTLTDYFTVAGNTDCKGNKVKILRVVRHILAGKDAQPTPQELDPYFDVFGSSYDAIEQHLVGGAKHTLWGAVLTIIHQVDPVYAHKIGTLMANNRECERGRVLHCIQSVMRDPSGTAPTGGGKRINAARRILSGVILHMLDGNVELNQLRVRENLITDVLKSINVEIVTFETLQSEYERLKALSAIQ